MKWQGTKAKMDPVIDELLKQGGTLQQAWLGESSQTQVTRNNPQQAPPPSSGSASLQTQPTSTQGPTNPPTTTASISPTPEKKTVTKTYASLVQYDGPKIKSGITLDAEFVDDGSGAGEGRVVDAGNRYLLNGHWAASLPQNREELKILDNKTLDALRLRTDLPWVFSRFTDNETVLECVYGETHADGQKRGTCRDNYGNRYHLYLRP